MNPTSASQSPIDDKPAPPTKQLKLFLAWIAPVIIVAVAVTATYRLAPRWAVMWFLSATIFYSFKWLSWTVSRRPVSTLKRKISWWFAWVGMDPERFLTIDSLPQSERPQIRQWLRSAAITIAGMLLFPFSIWLATHGYDTLAAWCGMFGLVFFLHFGSFDLLSCAWRAAGVNAKPIMNRPLSSSSAGEFWGRRWNLAFRDASYRTLFVPVARRSGAACATLAVFLFSGLVHELAISVPARAGFGLPTLYFLLQGITVLLENSKLGKQLSLGRGYRGRVFTLAIVFFPLPILFHPPFVRAVMTPFLHWIANI